MIAVEGLSKRFGDTVAVDRLSFTASSGSVLGFLGPNGAGKSTTLRVLLGLMAPTAGTATIEGRPYRELGSPARDVGAVLEGSTFHPGRSGRNHLRALVAAAGLPPSRVEEVLELTELKHVADKRVRTYSLGMRQRLGLAAAMLGDPRALVLDEPANGLDPQGIRWLRDFLRTQAGDGRCVLVSSHVLAEVAQTVDEVIVIARGRLVTQASLDELTRRAGGAAHVRTQEAARLADALRRDGARVERLGPDRLRVQGGPVDAVGVAAAREGIVIQQLTADSSTLEDVFLALTGGEGWEA
jgi:ABC-2 type transport system ATP-binding protein